MMASLYIEVLTDLSNRPNGVMPFGGCAIKREAIEIAIRNGDLHRMGFDVSFSDDYNRIKKHSIVPGVPVVVPRTTATHHAPILRPD